MAAELSQPAHDDTLQVYLLGCVPFDSLLRLQRRLHFDISGDRRQAALIVCEHPPTITVGRHGSNSHIHVDPAELDLRGWPVRWVNRGGGCILHVPGQLAVYPVLPLDRLGLGIGPFLHLLGETIRDLLGDFSIHANVRIDEHGVWVGERLLAAMGVSVREARHAWRYLDAQAREEWMAAYSRLIRLVGATSGLGRPEGWAPGGADQATTSTGA